MRFSIIDTVIFATTLAGVVGVLPFSTRSNAQTPATVPVGYLKVALPEGTLEAPSDTPFYCALQELPSVPSGSATGRITGVTAETLSDSSGNWIPGSLSAKATPYVVRITSGNAQGTVWQISTTVAQQNSATTLTVLNEGIDLTTLGISSGIDGYEIFPADTLRNLWGTETFITGPSATVADNVRIWNGGAWTTYYVNSDRNRWERANDATTDRGDIVLRPHAGMHLIHRGPATTLRLVGRVASTDIQIRYANGGDTYVGGFPITQTLAATGIQNLPGWKQDADYLQADLVRIWNGGAWVSYFYNPTAAIPQWQRVAPSAPADSANAFVPGRPVMLIKRGLAPGISFLNQNRPFPE